MSLKAKITEDMKSALKAKETQRLHWRDQVLHHAPSHFRSQPHAHVH